MKKFLEKIKPRLLIMCLIAGFWLIVIILRLVFAEYQSAYINEIYKPPFYPPVFVFYLVWGLTLIGLTVSTVLAVFKSKNKNLIVIIIFNGVLNILLPLFFYTLRSKISGVIILLFLIISAI